MCFHDQVGEFSLKPGSAHNVIVNPVIIAAAWFAKQNAVIFESVLVEPGFGDLAVGFCAAGEEIYDMSFVVPAIEHGERIGVGQDGSHTVGFFIGDIVANGAVNVYKKIPDFGGEYRADAFSFFIESFPEGRFRMFLMYHRVNFTQR